VSDARLDPLVHAPRRLAAMAILASSQSVEFTFLRDHLQVSDSVLSKHMKLLQEAGYVKVVKRGRGRGASTWYRVTSAGREAFDAHVAYLQSLVAGAPVSLGEPGAGD